MSMMNNGNDDIINSIPLDSLLNLNFNVSAVSPANLPDAYVNKIFDNFFKN